MVEPDPGGARPPDNYAISQGPGGTCANTESDQPNSLSFDAGTVDPIAGAFSPFVLNLNRDDGTQQFSKVTVSPPAGLVAKLAGTPACSEAPSPRPRAATNVATAPASKQTRPAPSPPR